MTQHATNPNRIPVITHPLPAVFAHLKTIPNLAVEDAMVEAIPTLDPPVAAIAIDILIERDHPPALSRVVAGYRGYSEELRGLIAHRLHDLHAALQSAVRSPALEERLGAIDAIRDGDDADSADLLGDAVRAQCPKTREHAAAALQELTARWLRSVDLERGRHDPADLKRRGDEISAALIRAVRGWELHFQRKTLEAALWMGDRVEPAVVEKLADPHARIAPMLNEIVSTASDPRLAGAVLRSLAYPAIRASAVKALSRINHPPFFEAALRESWLLGDPEVTKGCHWIREWTPVVDGIESARDVTAEKAERAARWIHAAGGPPAAKADAWRRLLRLEAPAMRRAAFWKIIEDPSEPATALLSMVAAGPDASRARVARRELHARRARAGVGTRNENTPESAPSPVKPHDYFEDFWSRVDALSDAERAAAALSIRHSVSHLEEKLHAKLAHAAATERFRALRVAADMKLLPAVADRIQQLAFDPDAMVRGLAVSLLVHLPGPTTARILRSVIHDPDPRVQANAVEVMDVLNLADRATLLKDKLASTHHRIRANAVKALLRAELHEAGDVLLDMLADPAASHRLSALWVVERLKLRSLLQRVIHLGESDPDERIRRRCRRLFRGLTDDVELQSGSSSRRSHFTRSETPRINP